MKDLNYPGARNSLNESIELQKRIEKMGRDIEYYSGLLELMEDCIEGRIGYRQFLMEKKNICVKPLNYT